MRCSVDAIVNSRIGPPSVPLVIDKPEAPAEKSPLIALTPECKPADGLDQHAIVDIGDQCILVALTGQQLQGQAPHTGGSLESAADRVPGALRADTPT